MTAGPPASRVLLSGTSPAPSPAGTEEAGHEHDTRIRTRSNGRRGRRLAASIVAIAMAAAISGPVAAVPLKLDQPGGSAVSVDPSRAESTSEFGAKLHTTAGYQVLVFG